MTELKRKLTASKPGEKIEPTPHKEPLEGERKPYLRFGYFTEDWKHRELHELATKVKRNDPTSEAPILMITANKGLIDPSERYASYDPGKSLRHYILLKQGELAYNRGASIRHPFGTCCALTEIKEDRVPSVYHCFGVGTNVSGFIALQLNGYNVKRQLSRIATSSVRLNGLLNISFAKYLGINLSLPSISEQWAIATLFSSIDRIIMLHQRKLQKLKELKRAYLNESFA